MEFEWDSEKATTNFEKHGISFELATQIFNRDSLTLKSEWVESEFRETDIGIVDSMILLVVTHTNREGVLRIISARKATKREAQLFDDYYS